MPDNRFAGLEKVTGKISSAASDFQKFLGGLSWEDKKELDGAFKGIKKIQDLNNKYRELLRTIKDGDEVSKAKLNKQYLSQYIVILNNYAAFFKKTQADIDRYEDTLYKLYVNKYGEIKFADGEDDSHPAVINKLIKGVGRNALTGMRKQIVKVKDDILEATADFHENLARQITIKYNLDVTDDLHELLINLYPISKTLQEIFEAAVQKSADKYNKYSEEASTGEIKPKNKDRLNNIALETLKDSLREQYDIPVEAEECVFENEKVKEQFEDYMAVINNHKLNEDQRQQGIDKVNTILSLLMNKVLSECATNPENTENVEQPQEETVQNETMEEEVVAEEPTQVEVQGTEESEEKTEDNFLSNNLSSGGRKLKVKVKK